VGYTTVCDKLLHSAKGRFLTGIHAVLGVIVVVANALAGGWGAVCWWRRIPSVAYWYILRVAQASVIVQVLIGLGLLASGGTRPNGVHYVYGIAPLIVTLVAEGMRIGAAQREMEDIPDPSALEHREQVLLARRVVLREMQVMTIGTLLVLTLVLRALQTG
jgi:uncharacterized iron-regulated membrane protein